MSTVTPNKNVIDLIAKFRRKQTPFTVTDIAVLRQNCRNLKNSLPGFSLLYAVKASFSREIIEAIDSEVDGFDVASEGEIRQLIKYGVSTNRMHLSNPVKSMKTIGFAHRHGIETFTVQSVGEVYKIAKVVGTARLIVRIKLSDSRSLVPLSSKFGCTKEEALLIAECARGLGLKIVGITFHAGSQVKDVEVWDGAIGAAKDVIEFLGKSGFIVEMINFGGGFPAQYFADDIDITTTTKHIQGSIEKNKLTHLSKVIEPGRYIAADATVIVSRIIAIEDRGGDKWIFIDTGLFQSFLGAVRYSIFPYAPVPFREWQPLETGVMDEYIITGPSCDSEDIIARSVRLPAGMKTGDVLVFPNTGAYTTTYGSEFNGFKLPKQYYFDTED